MRKTRSNVRRPKDFPIATIYREAEIDVSVDKLWEALSDVANVDKLLSYLESAEIDGDFRTCAMDGGGELRELIVSIDQERRRVAYSIVEGPFGFEHHSSSWRAVADGDKAVFIWETDVMPHSIAEVLEPVIDQSINDIRDAIESAAA